MAGDVSTTLQSLPAADCVIATKALTRRFGRHRGVFDLNLTVNRGEVFGFLGPNGAGKSTTIRILLGLYRRSAGHAAVLGMDPSRDTVQIHRQVGYLPGELALFPHLTGRDILKRFARVRGDVDLRYRDELVDRARVLGDHAVGIGEGGAQVQDCRSVGIDKEARESGHLRRRIPPAAVGRIRTPLS